MQRGKEECSMCIAYFYDHGGGVAGVASRPDKHVYVLPSYCENGNLHVHCYCHMRVAAALHNHNTCACDILAR
jgi:hypothetical protein